MKKRNIKLMLKRAKEIQAKVKELEREFYVAVGKATLKCLQESKNISELEQKVAEIKSIFGKED